MSLSASVFAALPTLAMAVIVVDYSPKISTVPARFDFINHPHKIKGLLST
jgi:hypothetical protein